MSAKL
jgi:hypothetical protein